MALDIFLAVAGAVLIIVGFAGTIVPVLPGAPLSWIGLLVAFFSEYTKISVEALVITGVIAVVVSIVDNIFPVVFTKQSGGSKESVKNAPLLRGVFPYLRIHHNLV